MRLNLKKNKLWQKFDESIPNDTLGGKVFRMAIYCFLLCIPFYLYEHFFGNTLQQLQSSCDALSLTISDKQRIADAMNMTGMGNNIKAFCTQLPVPNTELNTTSLTLFQQLFNFSIPFFGAIFLFAAVNFLVFSSMLFMYWVIVEEKFKALGSSFFRQYLTCSVVFLITAAVMIPTVSSIQITSLRFNGVNHERLAIDNRLLCTSNHTFKLMSKQNTVPMTSLDYRVIQLSNNQNGIICFGMHVADQLPKLSSQNSSVTYLLKFMLNALLFSLIPLFFTVVLNLFKKLLNRISNRWN